MSRYRSEIVGFLRSIGARDIDFLGGSHRHPQIVYTLRGEIHREGIAGTPSDGNAALLKILDLRRKHGLTPRLPRKGIRRIPQRRRRGDRVMVSRCPVLTALPDWRETLLPLWLEMCGRRRAAA